MDPEASQENLKRPEKAPKRHPKRHPKVVQKLVKKWLKSEPKNGQKKEKNVFKKSLWPQKFVTFLMPRKDLEQKKTKNEWSNLGMLFEQFWEFFGAHFGIRSAKEGAR